MSGSVEHESNISHKNYKGGLPTDLQRKIILSESIASDDLEANKRPSRVSKGNNDNMYETPKDLTETRLGLGS